MLIYGLKCMALISVGYTVHKSRVRNYSEIQQRLVPNANYVQYRDWPGDNIAVCKAFHGLRRLYNKGGKLQEAEEMYQRAQAGKENAFGSDHMSTFTLVNSLGELYTKQGKLREAE